MKIKDLTGKQLTTLLTELFCLNGAKEIFKKHNIEMVTKETEKQGLSNFIKAIENLLQNGQASKDYKQATMFLDTQIKSNESMLETAEGFMKTMISGMVESFKATKKGIADTKIIELRNEIKPLIEEHILNEHDKKSIDKYLSKASFDDFDSTIKSIKSIEKLIDERYEAHTCDCEPDCKCDSKECDCSKETEKHTEKPAKEKSVKEEKKPIELKTDEDGVLDGLDDLDFGEDTKEETKKEELKKEETKSKPVDEDPDLDFGNVEDLEEELETKEDSTTDKEEPKPSVNEVNGDDLFDGKTKSKSKKQNKQEEKEDVDDFNLDDEDLDLGDIDLGDNTEVDPFL